MFLPSIEKELQPVVEKILNNEPLTPENGLLLYQKASLGLLAQLADWVRVNKNADNVYFNRNFHIEPTNICIYKCKFCSYSRKLGESDSWEYSIDEILAMVNAYRDEPVTEVHIVGGVHPQRDIYYYAKMLAAIKQLRPALHIKAFTAVELDYMISKSGMTLAEGFDYLKKNGLDSIPGGGAEIFEPSVRKQLCHEKATGEQWIRVHMAAHKAGLASNATMLYGHVETYQHRIDHLTRLRDLQAETGGFNAFIPLKYRRYNNSLSHIGEVSLIEDLRNYAVCRLFLHNFEHLKAYWPMLGRENAQLALSFGVDDLDGTIDDTTKIYTMAGVKESVKMTTDDLVSLIRSANRQPVERDTLYNVIKEY